MDKQDKSNTELALIEHDPLKAALAYARRNDENLTNLRQSYGEFEEDGGMNFVKHQVSSGNHLPIEQAVIKKAKEIVDPWEFKRKGLACEIALKEKYKEFDLTPLNWRNRQGFPRLAVFDVASTKNDFTMFGRPKFDARGYDDRLEYLTTHSVLVGGREAETNGHGEIASCYQDIVQRLYDRAAAVNKFTVLQARFTGIIPDEIRLAIMNFSATVEQHQQRFVSIYLIAEINHWDLKEYTEREAEDFWREYRRDELIYSGNHQLARDPLVIGHYRQLDRDGRLQGSKFFLISFFDTTFLEDYLIEKTLRGEQ